MVTKIILVIGLNRGVFLGLLVLLGLECRIILGVGCWRCLTHIFTRQFYTKSIQYKHQNLVNRVLY